MRNWIAVVIGLCGLSAVVNADAPARRIGIGVVAGEPSGLSLKINFTDQHSIQSHLAYSFDDDEAERMQLTLDYLAHQDPKADGTIAGMRGYAGIGVLYKFEDGGTEELWGGRVPLGIVWETADLPVEVFIELVPVINLSPETEFDWNAGIGFRFVF